MEKDSMSIQKLIEKIKSSKGLVSAQRAICEQVITSMLALDILTDGKSDEVLFDYLNSCSCDGSILKKKLVDESIWDEIMERILRIISSKNLSFAGADFDGAVNLVQSLPSLSKKIIFDNKTGAIVNGNLPSSFSSSFYDGKGVLKMDGMKIDDEVLKQFDVKFEVLDAVLLTKIYLKNKSTKIKLQSGVLAVEELLKKSHLYLLLSESKVPFAIIALLEDI